MLETVNLTKMYRRALVFFVSRPGFDYYNSEKGNVLFQIRIIIKLFAIALSEKCTTELKSLSTIFKSVLTNNPNATDYHKGKSPSVKVHSVLVF